VPLQFAPVDLARGGPLPAQTVTGQALAKPQALAQAIHLPTSAKNLAPMANDLQTPL